MDEYIKLFNNLVNVFYMIYDLNDEWHDLM